MQKGKLKRRIADYTYRMMHWGQNRLPPGIRSLVGVLLMVGGVFGFLPVLGFWMLPLGVAFVALDVPGTRRHIDMWMLRLYRQAYLDEPTSNQ
ncbi:MAG TPA: hypothetical protein VIS55_11155 [Pseudomonadales bacterium]